MDRDFVGRPARLSLPGGWNAGSRDSTTGGRMLAAMHDAAAVATL